MKTRISIFLLLLLVCGLVFGAPTQTAITNFSAGGERNNYTSDIGWKFRVTTAPILVTHLGRWVVSGNTNVHYLFIANATGTALVTTNLSTLGKTTNQFHYVKLATPLRLEPNTHYHVWSSETNGGDIWLNNSTDAEANPAIDSHRLSYSADVNDLGSIGTIWGIPNFKFTVVNTNVSTPVMQGFVSWLFSSPSLVGPLIAQHGTNIVQLFGTDGVAVFPYGLSGSNLLNASVTSNKMAFAILTPTGSGVNVTVDSSGFVGQLSTSDNTLQEIANRVDAMINGVFNNITATGAMSIASLYVNNLWGTNAFWGAHTHWQMLVDANGSLIWSNTVSTLKPFMLGTNGTATGTVFYATTDNAYGAGWNGSLRLATENAVYDKIESLIAGGVIDDTAFSSAWNGVTTIGPSKNAVYDWAHTFDTDDDGLPDKVDLASAGFVRTTAGGVISSTELSGEVTTSGSGAATIADSVTVTGWIMGASTATTPSADDNDTSLATTAYVQTELTAYASDTVTFTTKTIDGANNVLKFKSFIQLTHPHRVDGTGATFETTQTTNTYGQAMFSHSADKAANWCEFYIQVPEDLDTSVDLRVKLKVLANGTDSGSGSYELTSVSVADSTVLESSSLANAITINLAMDATTGKHTATSGWTTLTGWRSALTAGQTWRIRLARDGDSGSDDSAVTSTSLGLAIEYGATQ